MDQRFYHGERLTSAKLNKIVEELNRYRSGGPGYVGKWPIGRLRVKNKEPGVDIDFGEVVNITDYTGPLDDPESSAGHISGQVTPFDSSMWPNNVGEIGIAASSIPSGEFGYIFASGIGVVLLESSESDHDWVWIDEDGLAHTGTGGQAKILHLSNGDPTFAIVDLSCDQPLWEFVTVDDGGMTYKLVNLGGGGTGQTIEITDRFGYFGRVDSVDWAGHVYWVNGRGFFPAGAPCEKPEATVIGSGAGPGELGGMAIGSSFIVS